MISTNEIKNKSTHRESMNYNELKFHPFPLYMCTRCMFIFVSTGFIEQNVTSEYYFFNIYIWCIFSEFSPFFLQETCVRNARSFLSQQDVSYKMSYGLFWSRGRTCLWEWRQYLQKWMRVEKTDLRVRIAHWKFLLISVQLRVNS